MKDFFDEALLRECAAEAEKELLAELPEEPHEFSLRFQRKMKRLLREQGRSDFGKGLSRFGRAAAAVLTAVLLVNLVLIGTVEAYREEVWKLTLRVTERFTEFRVTGGSTAPALEFVPIEPPYIPEGYEEIDVLRNDGVNEIIYSNGTGIIHFSQSGFSEGSILLNTEDADMKLVELHGIDIYVIEEGNRTIACWVYDESIFTVTGDVDYNEMMRIINSILIS